MTTNFIDIAYLISVILFVVGMKRMSHPESAKKGNFMATLAMILAILATFFTDGLQNKGLIIAAMAIGTIGGLYSAKKVQMTAMPQLVSFFNGMGGAAAALIGIVEYASVSDSSLLLSGYGATLMVSLIIGGMSFSGSIIAMGKLQGFVSGNSVKWPLQQASTLGMLLLTLGLGVCIMLLPEINSGMVYLLFGLSLVYGIMFVMPIGGADMPVVISLLNSFTGVTAATTGLLYNNNVMLMGGVLVGAAGIILTTLMCKAMNRSLMNVLLGSFKNSGVKASGDRQIDTTIREISLYDSAVLLSYAQKVVIVPGYGLAVAQAQHAVNDLEKLLDSKGVEVKYGIHPVAGRMPGHMNVLLAESNVSYDKLIEMDDINADFNKTDVVMVIGANDVVNPAAKDDPSSPIFGMPILEVNQAKNIIIIKRGMAKGYAGIENELFYDPKTCMLFGDAKDVLTKLSAEVKTM
jgi:H+-translocating NAD(P) transhydrogenase subunit beta